MTWRPLPRPGEVGPARLSGELDRLARCLGAPGASVLGVVFGRWDEIVGPVAPGARPLWLTNGVLVVGVDHPAQVTELRYRSGEVLDRLEEAAGEPVAGRVEVRVQRRR